MNYRKYTGGAALPGGLQLFSYLPVGHKSWRCAQCNELLALRKQVSSLEAKVADLDVLGEAGRSVDETVRNMIGTPHAWTNSSSAVTELRVWGKESVILRKREMILRGDP